MLYIARSSPPVPGKVSREWVYSAKSKFNNLHYLLRGEALFGWYFKLFMPARNLIFTYLNI